MGDLNFPWYVKVQYKCRESGVRFTVGVHQAAYDVEDSRGAHSQVWDWRVIRMYRN